MLVLHYLWWSSAKSTKSRVSGPGVTVNLKWAFHRKGKKKKTNSWKLWIFISLSDGGGLTCCFWHLQEHNLQRVSHESLPIWYMCVKMKYFSIWIHKLKTVKLFLKPFVTGIMFQSNNTGKRQKRHTISDFTNPCCKFWMQIWCKWELFLCRSSSFLRYATKFPYRK